MKLTLLTIFGICGTLNARLIEKNTNITTIETKTPQIPPRVRLTRDIFDGDTFAGYSKEDNGQSVEYVQVNSRKAREFVKSNPRNHRKIVIRTPRESHEKIEIHKNTSVTHSPKTKTVLVKKPIPKYHEMDYEDDFQMKVSGSPLGVADSGEHEDEDFNVDDYDFDVNHDEYVGRGKPLEPRVKNKESIGHRNRAHSKPVIKAPVPKIKIQSKAIVPTMPISTSKKERAAPPRRPNKKNKEIDYYDDTTTTVRTTEEDKKYLRDSDEDDGEDITENISKVPTRLSRSPWKNTYIEKLGEKSSNMLASKLLSVLPMFPALNHRQMEPLRVSEEPMYY